MRLWIQKCLFSAVCLLLPPLRSRTNTEAQRQVTFHKHLLRCVCVFYTSFGKESRGIGWAPTGQTEAAPTATLATIALWLKHKHTNRHTEQKKITQKLFLHSEAMCGSSLFSFVSLLLFHVWIWSFKTAATRMPAYIVVFIRKLLVVFNQCHLL